MKKMFRVGMACLLVLALLLYLSPVRVSASAIPEVAGVVTKVIPFNPGAGAAAGGAALGSQIFGYVLGGLGLVVTLAQTVDLMKRYSEFTGELETSIYYYPDGTWSYGVDMGFIERVRNFLFDSGVVVCNDVPVFDEPGMRDAVALAATKPYACVVHSTRIYICYSSFPFYVTDESGVERLKVIGDYYFQRYNASWTSVSSVATNGGVVEYFGADYCESEYQLGEVAPLTVTIPTGYPEWYTNARPATNPDTEEEILILPIPLNPSADPNVAPDILSQPEIWQGTIADPLPDTGALPDGSIAETPWNDVQDWLTPSGDPGQFGIQLRDYFPFCIPFDLYDFLVVLAAEPEAPCFEWEVPVPQMGRTFKVEVDLAAWDSVAALFRKLELLAFIVGLGWVTREKIRG